MKRYHLIALVGISGLLCFSPRWAKATEGEIIQAKLIVQFPTNSSNSTGSLVIPKAGESNPLVIPKAGEQLSNSRRDVVRATFAGIDQRVQQRQIEKEAHIREIDATIAARRQREVASRQRWAAAEAATRQTEARRQTVVTAVPTTRRAKVRRQTVAVAVPMTQRTKARRQATAAQPTQRTEARRQIVATAAQLTQRTEARRQIVVTAAQPTQRTEARRQIVATAVQPTQRTEARRQIVATAAQPTQRTEARRQTPEVPVAQIPATPSPETEQLTKKLDLEQVTFLCGVDKGAPATIAKINGQKELAVILWSSDFFAKAGYDSQTRCKQVSARFETYKKGDAPVYITTGKMNGQPVICATRKEKGNCGEGISVYEGLLFTLKPDENPQKTLAQLFTSLQSKDKPEQKLLEE